MSEDVQELVVERISKFGFQSGGRWYNPDKFKMKGGFGDLVKDSTVKVTINPAGFVTSVANLDGSPIAKTGGGYSGPKAPPMSKEEKDAKKVEIARAVAVKAVFGSPIFYDSFKGAPVRQIEEALMGLSERVTSYLVSGEIKLESDS
jgi:hypothetical protein